MARMAWASEGGGLPALGEAGLGGNGKIAVQPGVDAALAVELLVDVQYLLLPGAARLLLQPQGGQPPGIPGASAKHGGVDLHARGDAQHRCAQSQSVIDVPGSPVAAGKQDEVYPLLRQRLGQGLGVLSPGGFPLGNAGQQAAGKTQALGRVAAHGSGPGDHLEGNCRLCQGLKCLAGPLPGMGDCAPAQGLLGHVVGALQADAASQSGDGVDDQANGFHRHPPIFDSRGGLHARPGCQR